MLMDLVFFRKTVNDPLRWYVSVDIPVNGNM